MARTHTLLVAAGVTALVGALLSTPTYAGVADGPDYGAPTVGDCYVLDYADYTAMGESPAPVDCATEHTVQVSGVVHLPADTDWTVGSDDLARAELTHCIPAYYRALAKPYKVIAMAGFDWKSWIPTAEQRSHGATWFRCDVSLPGLLHLLPVPSPLLSSSTVPEELRSCLFEVAPALYMSACGDQYNWHVDKVFMVPRKKGQKYPSTAYFTALAGQKCDYLSPWKALWISKPMWRAGDHTLMCYRKESWTDADGAAVLSRTTRSVGSITGSG